jgi:heat shock protein HtpX
MKRVVVSLAVAVFALSVPVAAQASACPQGLGFGGMIDLSARRYDGVKATVTATSPFAGLNAKHDGVHGLVGIGDAARTYVSLMLDAYKDGDQLELAFEYRERGVSRHVPEAGIPSRLPWTVGHPHSFRIEHDRRFANWRLFIDGNFVGAVPLDDDNDGLPRPHVLMSVNNNGGRCDNRGTFLFSNVYVKFTTGAWRPFQGSAAAPRGYNDLIVRTKRLTSTSFAVGTPPSSQQFWGYWLRLYVVWIAGALVAAAALVLFWIRRSYWSDVRLSVRMFVALASIVLIYLPFLMLPVFWVYSRSSSPWSAAVMALVELCLVFAAPYYADRLVLRDARANLVAKEAAPDVYDALQRLCGLANLPLPRLAVTDSAAPHAFATGAGTSATIVVSKGLLARLEPEELEAVLAHELAHIANGDAFAMTALSLPVILVGRLLRLPGKSRKPTARIVGYIAALVLFWWLLAPFWIVWTLATLVMFTISRSREYVADRSAALLIGGPKKLMSALVRISDELEHIPSSDLREAGVVGAFLIVPAREEDRGFTLDALRMFPSHPSLSRRLERLNERQRVILERERLGVRPRLAVTWRRNPLALVAFVYAVPIVICLTLFPDDWGSWVIPLVLGSVLGTGAAFNAVGRAQAGEPGRVYATVSLIVCLVAPLAFGIGVVSAVSAALLDPFPLPL